MKGVLYTGNKGVTSISGLWKVAWFKKKLKRGVIVSDSDSEA